MSFSIYHNLVVKAKITDVYNAISQPKHLINWWPLYCKGIPEKGEIYNFNFTDTYNWFAEVISCETNNHIYYKMKASDKDWNTTTFGFDLKAENNTITIEFWHKDWQTCNAEFKQSSYCWAILLQELKNYLEKGTVISFENRE
ncbi:SRPBCC family protein [Winogradskyella immobilis]|uniref:SRPBCC domain-containing protein n=1 Tax=Winogradskyella immobilis TaxID=2816852 RepID=A0ABS8EIU0_9FLAO|nr:SRPBCC domain-containing protein [Winogradskyella immobilis]MCC1483128.1 SRPBCC domain-containing protein [Winogradskyella immobilis]MCG0015223.1 SRPBCC domain-containing protein [Winogradskyella immobilis]